MPQMLGARSEFLYSPPEWPLFSITAMLFCSGFKLKKNVLFSKTVNFTCSTDNFKGNNENGYVSESYLAYYAK